LTEPQVGGVSEKAREKGERGDTDSNWVGEVVDLFEWCAQWTQMASNVRLVLDISQLMDVFSTILRMFIAQLLIPHTLPQEGFTFNQY
jgi:hypothetical protein